MIFRNHKWDIPKGHMELNETPEETAVREVEEECGVVNLKITKRLIETFHMYEREGLVLKKTFWYAMDSDFHGELVPQVEEGIDLVEWKGKKDIPEMMKNSFRIVADVLEEAVGM